MTDIAVAEARATAAKLRLTATLAALQARLAPKALAREAAHGLIAKGQDFAQGGLDAAKKHPLPLAGVAAALGLFLARKPIAKLITRSRSDATPAPAASLTFSRAVKRN